VVLYLSTICGSVADVLARNVASPEYTAETECDPAARDDVENVATPADKLPVPRVAPPFLKVTISPLGGTPPLELTVAVKMTGCPTLLGLPLDASVNVVPYLLTVCVRVAEVLAENVASPE